MPKYRPRRHPDLRKPENRERMKGEITWWCAMVVVVWKSDGERKYFLGDLNKAIDFVEWLNEPSQKEDILDLRVYNDVWEKIYVRGEGSE